LFTLAEYTDASEPVVEIAVPIEQPGGVTAP
jgi:hypothetical protein